MVGYPRTVETCNGYIYIYILRGYATLYMCYIDIKRGLSKGLELQEDLVEVLVAHEHAHDIHLLQLHLSDLRALEMRI